MSNNKNDIFQSLTDKLEEKEFQSDASHWEAAEKMISSKASFWSPKIIAAVSSAVVFTGFVGYSLFSNNSPKEVVVENVKKEVENIVVVEKDPIVGKEIIVEKESIKESVVEELKHPVANIKINEIAIIPEKNIQKIKPKENTTKVVVNDEVDNSPEMDEEEFVEFIAVNDLQNNTSPIVKIVDNKPVLITPIVPNVFTPNNDGQNDLFIINNIDGNDWVLLIFNQLGEIVFESTQYKNQWDGGDLNEGSYIYKLYNSETNYQNSGLIQLKR